MMAGLEGLEGFEQIFGEAITVSSDSSLAMPNKSFFRVYASDSSHLTICVTDFQSNTWEALQSLDWLQDLRDNIGISGSWPEFLDYVSSSFRSEDVKLILDKSRKSDGLIPAKLVAKKSKGMPLISITLSKLLDCESVEAIAKFSTDLFKAYKFLKGSVAKDKGSSCQMTKTIEEGQNEDARTQIELHPHQQSKHKVVDDSNLEMSPEKAATRNKVTNPVVPAYRRTKKRGAILQNSEETQDS